MDTRIISYIKIRLDQDMETGVATILDHYTMSNIIKCFDELQAENKQYHEAIEEIEAVSCGEKQVAEDDSEGMGWIYKRIQALKE